MAEFLTNSDAVNFRAPSRVNDFIPASSRDLPLDFQEPPPFFLDAEEWEVYSARR